MDRKGHARTNGKKCESRAAGPNRPRVIVMEKNPLTFWAIERTLSPAYDVVHSATLEQAEAELSRSPVACIICGSPIADEQPEALQRLADVAGRKVVALVSDPDHRMSPNVRVLEKPFDLALLTALLSRDLPLARSAAKSNTTSKPEGTSHDGE